MGCLIGLEGAEFSVALRTTYLPGMIALDDVLAIKDLHYHYGVIFVPGSCLAVYQG